MEKGNRAERVEAQEGLQRTKNIGEGMQRRKEVTEPKAGRKGRKRDLPGIINRYRIDSGRE